MLKTEQEKKIMLETFKTKDKNKLKQHYLKCLEYIKSTCKEESDLLFMTSLARNMFKIKIKEEDKFSIEKIFVNFCHKNFYRPLFELLEKQIIKIKNKITQKIKNSDKQLTGNELVELTSFANLYCPFSLIKIKTTSQESEDLNYFLQFCDKKFKFKIEALKQTQPKESIVSVDFESIYTEFNQSFDDKQDLIVPDSHVHSVSEECKCCFYDINYYFSLELFENRHLKYEDCKLIRLKTTNTFKNSFERDFSKCLKLFIGERKFTETKLLLKDLQNNNLFRNHKQIRLHIYFFCVLCSMECAEYFECVRYIELGIKEAVSGGLNCVYFYFINLQFFIQQLGGFYGPSSCLNLSVRSLKEDTLIVGKPLSVLMDSNLYQLIRNFKLKTQIEMAGVKNNLREIRNLEFNRSVNIKHMFEKNTLLSLDFQVISLYIIEDFLCVNLFDTVIETNLNFTSLSNKFNAILSISRSTLKKKIETREDKADWWIERISLNDRLDRLLKEIVLDIEIKTPHVLLILDEQSTNFPWEHTGWLKTKHVYRLPSLEFVEERNIVVGVEGVNWIVDPDNNLEDTRKRITNYLSHHRLEQSTLNFNILLYFGHGGGSRHLKNIKNKIIFLFGCSSSKILNVKNFKRNGKVLSHLERGNIIVGCLWEVTDRDLDLISMKIIDNLFNGKCIACVIKEAIEVGKLKYLNGCSLVVYGLPTVLKEDINK